MKGQELASFRLNIIFSKRPNPIGYSFIPLPKNFKSLFPGAGKYCRDRRDSLDKSLYVWSPAHIHRNYMPDNRIYEKCKDKPMKEKTMTLKKRMTNSK